MTDKPYTKLVIRNLRVDMYIGIYEHEKDRKQALIVNIEAFVDHGNDINDDIRNVVSYEAIVNEVESITKKGHVNLVETVAEQIADYCLGYDAVRKVIIRLEKPDIIGITDGVGIEILRLKQESLGQA